MTSIALVVNPVAMATTQFNPDVCFDRMWIERTPNEKQIPRLSWVVVVDDAGKRQLQMCWQLKE